MAFETRITLTGPLRAPAQMLAEQEYGGHSSVHDEAEAEKHRRLHDRYRPDDNAADRAISIYRRDHPPANHAAQSIVIYDLEPRR